MEKVINKKFPTSNSVVKEVLTPAFSSTAVGIASDKLDEKMKEKSNMFRYLKDGILLTLVYSLAFYLLLVLFVSIYIYGLMYHKDYIFVDLIIEYGLEFIKYLMVGAFIGFAKHNLNYFGDKLGWNNKKDSE